MFGARFDFVAHILQLERPRPAYLGAKAKLAMMRIWAVSILELQRYMHDSYHDGIARKMLSTLRDVCDGNFIFDAC